MVLLREERIMSFQSRQVGLFWLVAVIGLNACAPRFVSLPSNLRADAQQIEYHTPAFTVRAPHGRWVTDSVVSVRHLKVLRSQCQSPYYSLVLAAAGYPAVLSSVLEEIRFFRVVRMQIVIENSHNLSDADACITVTSYPLIRHDSSAGAPENLLGFFQTVQQDLGEGARLTCSWRSVWRGARYSHGVGRFHELRIGERTFYEVALVPEEDSTKFCEESGVELLYVAQGKVFAVYVSSPGKLEDAVAVAESLRPRE